MNSAGIRSVATKTRNPMQRNGFEGRQRKIAWAAMTGVVVGGFCEWAMGNRSDPGQYRGQLPPALEVVPWGGLHPEVRSDSIHPKQLRALLVRQGLSGSLVDHEHRGRSGERTMPSQPVQPGPGRHGEVANRRLRLVPDCACFAAHRIRLRGMGPSPTDGDPGAEAMSDDGWQSDFETRGVHRSRRRGITGG